MRLAGVLGIALVLCCGVALAEGDAAKASSPVMASAKGMVEFEGVMVTPAMAAKLKKGGYRRYHDMWETHNVHELATEIDSLNLLNGLFLSEVQMRHLMNVAIKAEKTRRAYEEQIEVLNGEMTAALAGLKKDLLGGKTMQDSAYQAQVCEAKKKMREMQKRMNQEMVVCETYAKAVLTPNQREVCYTYKHCLIPPRELTMKSANIGQADASSVAGELLDKIRKMSDEEYAASQEQLVSMHLNHAKTIRNCGDLTPAQREKERSNFLAIVTKARSLDDLEYQFQKTQLAAQLPNDFMEVKERLTHAKHEVLRVEGERSQKNTCGMIGQMMLRPCMIPILARRLKIYADWQNLEKMDLDDLDSQACLGGSCAID
jgi:hypothetical protein